MPAPVTPFVSDTWPTSKALNLALYTCDGTSDNPNGIAFHACRPVLFEAYSRTLAIPASSGGTQTSLSSSGTVTTSMMVYDTAGYYGQSSDQPGAGYYQFRATVNGSAGDGTTAGGWMLLSHFAPLNPTTTQTSVSADLTGTAQTPVSGTRQAPSGTLDSCPFFLDLVQTGPTTTWSPAVTVRDSAGAATTNAVNTSDASGETPRFYAIWAAVSATAVGQATYSTGGTFPFTAPAGVTSVTVAATGGGGGGGAGNSGTVATVVTEYGGGGAGGGEFAGDSVPVTGGSSYPVTVGTAGAGGVTGVAAGHGGAGGDSVFTGDGPSVRGHGGAGGDGATTSAAGAGGAGGTGSAVATHFSGGGGSAGGDGGHVIPPGPGGTGPFGGGGGSSGGTGQAGADGTSFTGAPAPAGGGPGGHGGLVTITTVQATHASITGTNHLTVTMPATFQAGNTVLVFLYYQGRDVTSATPDPTVTLSDGTPFGSPAVSADVVSSVSLQVGLFNAFSVAGGETGVTITCNGTDNSVKAILCEVHEIAGLGPSPAIDVSTSHTQGPGSPDNFYTSHSAATTTGPELWVAMTGAQYFNSFSVNPPASSEGWSSGNPRYATNGGFSGAILTAQQVRTGPGTMLFNGTFSRGVTKGTFAAAYTTSAATTGTAPLTGPGGGGGGGLATGNSGGNGADGQVTLTWTGISGSGYGTPPLPTPYSNWSGATTVGATFGSADVNLNGPSGIAGPVNFLSNPPALRISAEINQTTAPGTITTIAWGGISPALDNYSGWVTNEYSVQRDGLYLVHGLASFAASSAGNRQAALTVGATTYWGPATPAPSSGTANCPKTQILSLHAGDLVKLAVYQTTGSGLNLATTDQTRMLIVWLGEQGVPASLWSPPDTTFRWQSGTMGENLGGDLSALFQQHLASDLGFLCNRPYLLAYQATPQSGLSASAFSAVTLDTVGGIIHGADNGDNYSGWTPGAANLYTAQVPGWYLMCGEFFVSNPASPGATVTAAVLPSTSGGVTPSATPDRYQIIQPTTSASMGGGATVFGLQYLLAGETVTPQVRTRGYGATYSTLTGSANGGQFSSHFEMVWLSELPGRGRWPVPSQFAPLVAPSAQSWAGIGRENYTGTPVMPTAAVPVDPDAYEPEDTPVFLHDQGVRATMGGLFGTVLGPLDATFSFGFPLYLDSAGYWLDNVLGDLSTVAFLGAGTPGAPLSNPLTVGATSLNTGSSFGAVGPGSIIQINDGAASEVVTATSGTAGTAASFTGTPCRFAHSTSAIASLATAAISYTHTFALLNSGSGQPATHTITDWTGLTPTVGARAYPSAVVAQLDLTGDAAGLVMAKVAGVSWLSAPAAAVPVVPGAFTAPPASWASTITLGGQPVLDAGEWAVSFKRQVAIYWGAGNAQTPYIIARGPLTVTGGLDYTVPSDEGPLEAMLAAGPLPLAITVGNGLPGSAALSMTIACSQVQAVKAKPARGETLIGYQDEWVAVDNLADVGGSGGLGPGTVTLVNETATY